MTFVSVLALGFGVLLVLSALEDVSLVQTYRDIMAGKSLAEITAPGLSVSTTGGQSGQSGTSTPPGGGKEYPGVPRIVNQ